MRKIKYKAHDILSDYYFTPSLIDFDKGIVFEKRGMDFDGNPLYRKHILNKTCYLEEI